MAAVCGGDFEASTPPRDKVNEPQQAAERMAKVIIIMMHGWLTRRVPSIHLVKLDPWS